VPAHVSIRNGRPNEQIIARPRPPTDEQISAYLANRDRDVHDLGERGRARQELASLEADRLALLSSWRWDVDKPT
jgi:hypothetical protein